MTTTNFDLYRAAIAADDAFHAELVRVWKSDAGTMRYHPSKHTDAALLAARAAFETANQAWIQEMLRVRDLAI